jgi:DNA polymerase III subunit epsilon
MNTEIVYEYWDAELKNQSKQRLATLERAIAQTDGVILDTETTGLYDAEIVEIVIINHLGETLLNTLVKPSIPIPPEVVEIHGITDKMVESAPSFSDIYPRIVEVLKDKRVLIYNAEFDIGILDYCRRLHGLRSLKLKARSECIMEWHAQWVGRWNNYYEDYRYHPLCGGHRVLDDCLAALERIKKIAADSDEIQYPPAPAPASHFAILRETLDSVQ